MAEGCNNFALLVATTRNSRSPVLFPLRALAVAYTDIMRGVPVILWIYLIGFGVPGLGMERPWNSPLIWGSVALVLTYASYVSEVFRAGIESVHESQRAAARSLGLGTAQTMRFVVLPQAVRRVIPPLMNDLVSLQKDVALVSVLGMLWIYGETNDVSRIAAHSEATFWFVLPSLPMFLVLPVMLRHGIGFYVALGLNCLLTALLYLAMARIGGYFGLKL